MDIVEAFGISPGEVDEAHRDDFEIGILSALQDLADYILLGGVWFDNGQCCLLHLAPLSFGSFSSSLLAKTRYSEKALDGRAHFGGAFHHMNAALTHDSHLFFSGAFTLRDDGPGVAPYGAPEAQFGRQ